MPLRMPQYDAIGFCLCIPLMLEIWVQDEALLGELNRHAEAGQIELAQQAFGQYCPERRQRHDKQE